MNSVLTALLVMGSLGVFLVGYRQITGATMRLVAPRFRAAIGDPSRGLLGRFRAGALVAAGGSSASGVVSLVTMVDGSVVAAEKTPWIMVGINFGASFACWCIALFGYHAPLAIPALVIMACALPFRLSGTLRRYNHGDVLTGIGLMMIGIDLLAGRLTTGIDPASLNRLMHLGFASPIAPVTGFLLGVIVSAVIRSSVGTVVLAMSLATREWLPLPAAAGVALGSTIGLTVTAFLAARSLGNEARRAALFHLSVSLGVCVCGAVLFPVLLRVEAGPLLPVGTVAVAVAVVLFHTSVNTLNVVLFLAIHRLVVKVGERLIPRDNDAVSSSESTTLALLPQTLPESLEANLVLTQSGLARMAEWAYEMLMVVINVSQVEDDVEAAIDRTLSVRASVKDLEEQISSALTRSVQLPCSRRQAERIAQQQRIAHELSLISDDCYKTARLLARGYRKNYRFHQESQDELFDFTSQILDFLKYISDYLEGRIERPDWELANRMEDTIDKVRDKLKKQSRKVLEKNNDADVRGELAFIDIVAHLEHVGDRCLSISETVRKLSPPLVQRKSLGYTPSTP